TQVAQDRVKQGVPAASRADAERKLEALRTDDLKAACPPPLPSPTPSAPATAAAAPSPAHTVSTHPTAKPTPPNTSPSPTPSPSATPPWSGAGGRGPHPSPTASGLAPLVGLPVLWPLTRRARPFCRRRRCRPQRARGAMSSLACFSSQ